MKVLSMLIPLMVLGISAYPQQKLKEGQVPSAVKSAFTARYPHLTVENWTKEDTLYVAEFKWKGNDRVAFFRPGGALLKAETRIHTNELPPAALAYIRKNYPGKAITDAVKTSDPAGNRIYEAEVEEMDLIFDANGKFISAARERAVEE